MGPTTCVGGGTCLSIARTHAVLRGVRTLEIDHGHPGISASQPAVPWPKPRQELAAGDLPQASEKGWGATVQILKAVAEQRGWEHSRHRHHLVTVSRLRSATGDGCRRRLFRATSDLHENTMQAFEVAESLDDVEGLLGKLPPLLDQT